MLPLYALRAALGEDGIGAELLTARTPATTLGEAAKRMRPAVIILWAQLPDNADVHGFDQVPGHAPQARAGRSRSWLADALRPGRIWVICRKPSTSFAATSDSIVWSHGASPRSRTRRVGGVPRGGQRGHPPAGRADRPHGRPRCTNAGCGRSRSVRVGATGKRSASSTQIVPRHPGVLDGAGRCGPVSCGRWGCMIWPCWPIGRRWPARPPPVLRSRR